MLVIFVVNITFYASCGFIYDFFAHIHVKASWAPLAKRFHPYYDFSKVKPILQVIRYLLIRPRTGLYVSTRKLVGTHHITMKKKPKKA